MDRQEKAIDALENGIVMCAITKTTQVHLTKDEALALLDALNAKRKEAAWSDAGREAESRAGGGGQG